MIKITCKYISGSTYVIYLDETLALSDVALELDKDTLHTKLKNIAATFIHKHSSNLNTSQTYFYRVEDLENDKNATHSLAFLEVSLQKLVEADANYRINTSEQFPDLGTLEVTLIEDKTPAPNNPISKELEENEFFYNKITDFGGSLLVDASARIEQNKFNRELAVKPDLDILIKKYEYNRDVAIQQFHLEDLDWNTQYAVLNEAVEIRTKTVIEPLERDLTDFKKAIADLRSRAIQVTQATGSEEFAQFTEEKIAELDPKNESVTLIETAIADEKVRLRKSDGKAFDREIKEQHTIYSHAETQLIFFNKLLAWYLYNAAKKYWDTIRLEKGASADKKATFDYKFKSLGIHIQNDEVSSIQGTYNKFFQNGLYKDFDKTQNLVRTLLADCNRRWFGHADGLIVIHEALKAFDDDCREVFKFDKKFEPYVKQSLFTAYYTPEHTNNLYTIAQDLWHKTTFTWNKNAKDIAKIIETITNDDYNSQFRKKITELKVSSEDNKASGNSICQPLIDNIDKNTKAVNAIKEATAKLSHLQIRLDGPTVSKRNLSDDNIQFKAEIPQRKTVRAASLDNATPIRRQLEIKREEVILNSLKNKAGAIFNEGKSVYEEISTFSESEKNSNLRARAKEAFEELSKLHALAEGAPKSRDILYLPGSMENESTKLKTILAELIKIKESIELAPPPIKKEVPVVEPTPVSVVEPVAVTVIAEEPKEEDAATLLQKHEEQKRKTAELIKQEAEQQEVNRQHAKENSLILANCRRIILTLTNNLAFWDHHTRNGGVTLSYRDREKYTVPRGIAEMINKIKEYEAKDAAFTPANAKALLQFFKDKGLEAIKRKKDSWFKYSLFSARNESIDNFYSLLANADNDRLIPTLEKWKKETAQAERQASRCCC